MVVLARFKYIIMLKRNDIAPDFSLPGTDGKTHSLHASLRDGHNALLIFLRHLG